MKDDDKTKKQLIHELTELRSQNAALKKSESPEKYRSLVEDLRDVIYELDSQGVVLYISPAIRDLLGYDSAEIVGKNFIELAHKDDLSSRAEWFSELRKGVESLSEYRIIDKSGKYKWAQTRVRPIIEGGQFKGARGILIDVTDQRRVEEALRESEELFRSYLEYAPDGVYMSDLEGNFLYGNLKCEEIIGYRREELIGKNFLELNILPEKSLNKAAQLLQANIEGKSTGPDEIELISKEGRIIPVEISTSVVQRMGQRIILAFVRDISDRKRTVDALRESEEKYRWVLNNMADVITVMDMNLCFTYISPSIIRMRGYTAEEATAQTLEQVMTPESLQISVKVFEEEMKLEASGTADPDRIRIVVVEQYRKDGSIVLMENHLSFMRDETKKPVGIISVSHDITARKQAEVNLKESKELTDAVVENVPLMIFLKEAEDLRFVIFNRAGEELLGYDRKALLGKNNLDLFPPEQAAHFMAKDREVLDGESGILDIPEEPILTAKKGQRLLHTRKICIKGTDGVTKYLLGISEDITDRKRAEEELRLSEERLRDILFSVADWVWEVDENGVYTYSSQKGFDLFGKTRGDIIGKTPFDFMPPDEAKRVAAIFSEIVANKAPIKDLENWNIRRNGQRVCLLTNGVPILDEEGNLKGYRGIDKDITERKQAEELLRLSEQNFRRSLDGSPLGVAIVSEEAEILYVNRMIMDFFGYESIEELRETPFTKRYTESSYAESLDRKNKRRLHPDDSSDYEIDIVRKDGEVRHLQVWRTRVLWNFKEHYQVIYRDDTDRKRAEKQLQRYPRKSQEGSWQRPFRSWYPLWKQEIPIRPVTRSGRRILPAPLPRRWDFPRRRSTASAWPVPSMTSGNYPYLRRYCPNRQNCRRSSFP